MAAKMYGEHEFNEVRGGFSHQRAMQQHGGRKGPRCPELYSIHYCTVKHFTHFGAFIGLSGYDRDGLLHISHISEHKPEKPEDLLQLGERIWAKVIRVDSEGKYGLDMRNVNQTDGEDNDPDNVRLQGRGQFNMGGATSNTTCSRCGGTGHASHECFAKSGLRYSMIDELGIPPPPPFPPGTGANAISVRPQENGKEKHSSSHKTSETVDKKRSRKRSHKDKDRRGSSRKGSSRKTSDKHGKDRKKKSTSKRKRSASAERGSCKEKPRKKKKES